MTKALAFVVALGADQAGAMRSKAFSVLAVAFLLVAGAAAAQTPSIEGAPNAEQAISRWHGANATCRSPTASALAAVGGCEQRDTYSKLLAQMNYCYGPVDKAGAAVWSPCDASKASQDSVLARTTARFQRMGGVFVFPTTINGGAKSHFIPDS